MSTYGPSLIPHVVLTISSVRIHRRLAAMRSLIRANVLVNSAEHVFHDKWNLNKLFLWHRSQLVSLRHICTPIPWFADSRRYELHYRCSPIVPLDLVGKSIYQCPSGQQVISTQYHGSYFIQTLMECGITACVLGRCEQGHLAYPAEFPGHGFPSKHCYNYTMQYISDRYACNRAT